MRFAVETMGFGTWSEPAAVMELAEAAEAAGWDGLFLWDHCNLAPWAGEVTDPWIALAAAATRTSRIRLGTSVTPVPRHAPHALARTLTAVDRLSNGRVTLGAGLGLAEEYARYGDHRSDVERAAYADELLEVVDHLLRGDTVDHHGPRIELDGVRLGPLPVQRPRIPIWIGGVSRPALRRAARWDGWVAYCVGPDGAMFRSAAEVGESIDVIRATRAEGDDRPFDVAVTGNTRGADDLAVVADYEAVGVTWWLESVGDLRGVEASIERVAAGPPRPH